MKIISLRKLLLYAMMACAFLGVQLSGELSPIVIGLFWSGLAVSWFWEAPRISFRRWAPFWTWATVAVFAFSIVDVTLLKEFFLISAMNFALFLATAKLFQLAEDKDYTQAMALSLMLLSAGAVLNDNMSYGIMFGLYAVIATLALTTQHVAVETATYHRERMRSMRMERSIVYSTVVLGLLVFAGSTIFFFTFPRVGVGAFVSQSRRGVNSSGFGESVELGAHGRIRDDSTIAMRVVFPGEPPMPIQEIHWRGLSLDFYDGRSWSDTDESERNVSHFPEVQGYGLAGGRAAGNTWDEIVDGAIVAEINLEPLGQTDILFTIGQWRGLTLPNTIGEVPGSAFGRMLSADETGTVELRTRSELGKRYLSYSRLLQPSETDLRAARWWDDYYDLGAALRASYVAVRSATEPGVLPPEDLTSEIIAAALEGEPASRLRRRGREDARRYLQLPPGLMSERMSALASELRATRPIQYDYVVAVEQWLKDELEYTTDLPEPEPGANLVDSFLFEWQRGHCEYFATAMVMLLREQGVPARIVNGYLGGDYNDIGRYYAVRQANAHSWVEVFFPNVGWVEFDPTPGGAADMGPQGVMRQWSLFVDTLRLAWFRWVVEYDLEKQFTLFRDVATQLSGRGDDTEQFTADTAESARQLAFWLMRNIGALMALIVLHIVGILYFRRRALMRIELSTTDRLAALGWAGAGVGIVVALWSERNDPRVGYTFAVIPPMIAYGVAWLARGPRASEERRERTRAHYPVSTLYFRLLQGVERAGGQVPISLTPEELAPSLELQTPGLAQRVRDFVAYYSFARFSGETPPAAELKQWKREVDAIVKLIRAELRERERQSRGGS